jgi:hypothetical protein
MTHSDAMERKPENRDKHISKYLSRWLASTEQNTWGKTGAMRSKNEGMAVVVKTE